MFTMIIRLIYWGSMWPKPSTIMIKDRLDRIALENSPMERYSLNLSCSILVRLKACSILVRLKTTLMVLLLKL